MQKSKVTEVTSKKMDKKGVKRQVESSRGCYLFKDLWCLILQSNSLKQKPILIWQEQGMPEPKSLYTVLPMIQQHTKGQII